MWSGVVGVVLVAEVLVGAVLVGAVLVGAVLVGVVGEVCHEIHQQEDLFCQSKGCIVMALPCGLSVECLP